MASTRWPLVSLMRSENAMDGATAYRSAWAPRQSKTSSAMSGALAEGPRPDADLPEELGNALACLGTAVKPAPVQAHPAGQLIAGIDRHEEVRDALVRAADQDGLHIGLGGGEQRVRRGQPVPCLQVERALGGAGRARVKSADLLPLRAAQEERQPDRYLELIPLGDGKLPGRVVQVAVGHRAVPAPAGPGVREEQVARPAGADERRGLQVSDVAVPGRDIRRAQLALLPRRDAARGRSRRRGPPLLGALDETAQSGAAAHVRAACAGARRAACGSATRTPRLSASSGSGSRCAAGSSRPFPASRTSYRAAQAGQVSSSRSSVPPASDEPQAAQASR